MASLANQLLSLLPHEDHERFLADCERVPLESRQIVIDVDEPVREVFLPIHGIISQLTVLNDGNAVEVGTIGSDGFVGLSSYLGVLLSPSRFVVQVPGEAWRIPSVRLRNWTIDLPRLQTLLARYNDFMLAVAAQTAACNRLHSVDQRCARWLLRARDRMDSNDIPLTQDFLAQMLGVRRASVSIAAAHLQDIGLIRYSYGRVTILDQHGLELVACECVATIRRRYEASFASLMG